ncbi:MAG TPA: hypothetical protein VLT59_13850 [Steroidobacteraceae bacterium]|nr:hypothetical protein [Steroidobacteraceae bacterium]
MLAVELGPIVKSIEVERSADEAFRIFTQEMTSWWPLASHSRARDADGEASIAVTIEPRIGGRVFETLNTGAQRDGGQVLAWEPGARFALLWQMGRSREEATEVEVRFETITDATCRVTLTHSHWERLGERGSELRGQYEGGWDFVFGERYAGRVTAG